MDKTKKEVKNKYLFLYQRLGIGIIILIWFLTSFFVNNQYILPSILDTFNSLINLLKTFSTYQAFFLTFVRTLISILISIIIGLIIGTFAGLFHKFELFMKPIVNLMRFIPVPCFIFILKPQLFEKLDFLSIIISFFIVFPLIYEAIVHGINNISEDIKLSLKLEGYYKPNSIFKVLIPLSFPYLNVAIIDSIGLGVKISVMSEIIIGSSKIWGIGRLIYVANQNADFPMIFAVTILIIILFLIIDLILNYFKKRLQIAK